jgi:hypothetical protein
VEQRAERACASGSCALQKRACLLIAIELDEALGKAPGQSLERAPVAEAKFARSACEIAQRPDVSSIFSPWLHDQLVATSCSDDADDGVGNGGSGTGAAGTTTIHIAGGSLDGMGSSKVKTPTAYICGQTDFALSNCQRDFQNVRTQPTFFSELQGTDHVGAARAALPGMVAWLRWHLAGEVERKAMFSPSGQFFTGIWKSQTKNW